MTDRLEILRERLIDDHPQLALEVLAASARLGRPLGWHYVLDLIWLLRELELPRGATVLDAGAGWGVLQFMLADRGYRVISVDMAARRPPGNLTGLYNFELLGSSANIKHPYLTHGRAANRSSVSAETGLPDEAVLHYPHVPTLTLYRGELSNLEEIPTSSVDAVVSVSALEHNPPEQAARAALELERVARPGAPLLLTLSACEEEERFHAESHSYLLNGAALTRVYRLAEPSSDLGDYAEAWRELLQPRYLDRWLPHCYGVTAEHNGMPRRVWAPAYLPIGLRKGVVKPAAA
jgi:hypothetical protein